jgi:hypothetical protein
MDASRGLMGGRDTVVRGETGDKTDQETEKRGDSGAASLAAMEVPIPRPASPHEHRTHPWPSIATRLRFDLDNDVETADALAQSRRRPTSAERHRPGAAGRYARQHDAERRSITQMIAKPVSGLPVLL